MQRVIFLLLLVLTIPHTAQAVWFMETHDPFMVQKEMDKAFKDLKESFETMERQQETILKQIQETETSARTYETADSFNVEVKLPQGMDNKAVSVTIKEGQLIIQAKEQEEKETAQGAYQEQRQRMLYHMTTLPQGAQGDKMMHMLKDGVLKVRVPIQKDEGKRGEHG